MGIILGLDLEGTLEVSNSFPLPMAMLASAADDDEKSGKNSGTFLSFTPPDVIVIF